MQQILYLAKRDKKGVIFLSLFEGERIGKVTINDISTLGLNEENEKTLKSFYQKYYMDYEMILESAVDLKSLKQKLLEKGFTNLPIVNQFKFGTWKRENSKNFIKSKKIMLQKRSSIDKK
jgi:hypothetical protein